MISLAVQLRSTLVGLIDPLYNPSVKLTDLTKSIDDQFAWQLYLEMQEGPSYKFSPGFLASPLFLESTLESQQKEYSRQFYEETQKRLVDLSYGETLRDVEEKVYDIKPAFDTWSEALQNKSPDLLGFLYYMIVEKHMCEEIKFSRQEAQDLSAIFLTLSENHPPIPLVITIDSSDGSPVLISNASRTFKKLSNSFRELADKKITDPEAKLSLKNIVVY